jgi:hypothetical protein
VSVVWGLPRKARNALEKLPEIEGARIRCRFLPELMACKGELLSGGGAGVAVHAGAFIRKREIVLETELLDNPQDLSRILVHEIFHFVWLRMGNAKRRSFEELLAQEFRLKCRGELGWSAQSRKALLTPQDPAERTRRWREYAAESFCDSAARMFSVCTEHEEYTLAKSFRLRREAWFLANLPSVMQA